MANSGNAISREEDQWTVDGVSGVAVVSDAGADDTYALGEEIQIRVSFTDMVRVYTEGGIPRLKIDMDPGPGGEKWAAYESGDYTSELTFVHTVVEPDISTQGIAVLADTLEANGATIWRYTGYHADLSHDGLGHDAAHKVDWRLSPQPPEPPPPEAVSAVAVVSDPGADATYAFRDTIRIRVRFGEAMDVTGAPRLKIALRDGDSGQRWAVYEGGSGTDSLTFAYIVAELDSTGRGTAVLANTLELNGGTIRSAATGTDADLSHDGLDKDPAHQVDWFHSAADAEVTSHPASGDLYGPGETIRIKVTFSEAVDVTGAPRQAIDLVPFGDGGEAWAAYEGGSGTPSLTFVYTVAESDTSERGLAVSNLLELNGGTIRWTATQADVPVANLDGKAGVLHHGVYQYDTRVDPGVQAVYVVSRPASGDTYDVGETIRLEVSFTEEVDVTGMPRLKIKMDPEGAEKWADYEGIPGSWRTNQEFRTFTYTVAEPDVSTQGIAVLANSLELNGGTIKTQATGTDVDLAHDGEDHDPAQKVNWLVNLPRPLGVGPLLELLGSGGDTYRDTYGLGETIRISVGFSEDVLVAGTPRLKIKMDPEGAEKWATYEGSATGTLLDFAYTVVEPDISTQGIAVLANTLELNGGLIWSAGPGGELADLSQHVGQGHSPLHKVDWTLTPGSNLLVKGELAILGVAQVGETLTARSVGVMDGDGMAGAKYFYQWMSNDGTADSDIAGAIGENYTIAAADAGRTIKVRASFTDDKGNSETLTSAATAAVSARPLTASFEGLPEAHDGRKRFGFEIRFSEEFRGLTLPALKRALAVTGGRLIDAKRTVPGQNRSVRVRVRPSQSGALTLALAAPSDCTAADAICASDGRKLSNAVTATVRGPAALVSNAAATGSPTITGTAKVGETLTASTAGIADADGLTGATFAWQWVSDPGTGDADIAGATASSYTLADADEGRTVKVRVSFTDDAGNAETLTSAATAAVAPQSNRPATGSPTITGTAQVGETLTASTAGISDADGLANAAFAFQWVAVRDGTGTDIVGATASSYTLADADAGAAIKVRVSFTDDAGNAEALTSAATVPVALPPLTAAFHGMPAEHDGRKLFAFEIRFSEEFEGLKLTAFKAGALQVTDGRLVDAKRTVPGKNRSVTVRVRPTSFEDMEISLPATADCSAAAAICTKDGRKLSTAVAATVRGPAALTVADAEANEGTDEAVEFAVSLSRAASGTVTVDYATRDGTAKAGEDYTRTRGTLTFAEGELEKTVLVPILDDAIDEGAETFTLKLMNARGAAIADGEATGTIENSDPLQKMWLSRFGRTVASHVTEAVSDRLAGPLAGGQVTVAGQSVDLARSKDEAWVAETVVSLARALGASEEPSPEDEGWPGSGTGGGEFPSLGSASERSVSGRELLLGSTFHLTREGDGGGPGLAAWGRVTVGGFDGEAPAETGNVGIEGEVTTGILGTDAEWDRLLAGVAVSLSEGEGTFAQSGVDSGTIESTLTTVSPYARVMVSERVSTWGLLGFGTGDMTIVQAANDRGQSKRVTRTDIGMRMAALGGRGALLQADDTGGLDLALKTDAFFVETESEAVSNEGSTTADASRLRLILEGSRAFETGGGGVLTPGLELGLRHDGGDAETGTGVELGGRVSYADAGTGLSLEASVRTLIAHEASGYEEWGASGAVRLAPGASGRGLSFRLAPTWGTPSSGAERLWSARDARALAPDSEFTPERRLEGELGYGLSLFGDRFTGTPNVGFGLADSTRDYTLGWRLTRARGDLGFEVNLDATRRETTGGNAPPEHGVMLRGAIRW